MQADGIIGRSMLRVYLSSTSKDLAEYRQAALRAIRLAGFECSAMEEYVSADETALQWCLQDVLQCNVYIGLIGFRYGFRPSGQMRSITELEYRHAKQEGLPCLIFLVKASASWLEDRRDCGEDLVSVLSLRREIEKNHVVSYFLTPEELCIDIASSLARFSQASDQSTIRDARAWALATQRDTVEGYEQYLECQSKGLHREEAKNRIARKLREVVIMDPYDSQVRYRYLSNRSIDLQYLDIWNARRIQLLLDFLGGTALGPLFSLLMYWDHIKFHQRIDQSMVVTLFILSLFFGAVLSWTFHKRRQRLSSELGPLPWLYGKDLIILSWTRRRFLQGHYHAWRSSRT